MKRWLGICLVALGGPGFGLDLILPEQSRETYTDRSPFSSYLLPVGPYADGALETIVAEGAYSQRSWEAVAQPGSTTLELMDRLRQQIEGVGFEVLFECETDGCGGFDFRFATSVVQEPDMFVDLGDFRFLSAQRLGQATPEYVSLLVSRSVDRSYLQVTHVGPKTLTDPVVVQDSAPPASSLSAHLTDHGSVVLGDLRFETGSAQLGSGPFASLEELASFLNARPEQSVTLVGHTDFKGALERNIALSKRRAQAVADRLIASHDVDASQLRAEGVGYLAPRSSNATEAGRALNRRVEAVLGAVSR